MSNLKKKPCDVIITDIQMPYMDGITLLGQVKKLDPYVEVIIMTGFATIDNVLKILRQNCAFDVYRKQNDHIKKLMPMVKQALSKKSLNKQNQQLVKALTQERTMARAAFDSISDPIVMLNFKMIIIGANKAVLSYSKIKNFSDCIGQPCYKVLCQAESCPVECQIGEHMQTEKTIRFQRQGLKDSDKIENISIYPSIVKKHRLGILVKIQDITHQIEVERQMTRADRLASLGQLSGGIAHEIRNPLAGIKLYLDIFADEDRYERSKDEKEFIDEIDTNINKINGIIKRVLTFSNPAESEMNYLDINQLIVDSLDLFSEKLKESDITKNLYLNESIPKIYM